MATRRKKRASRGSKPGVQSTRGQASTGGGKKTAKGKIQKAKSQSAGKKNAGKKNAGKKNAGKKNAGAGRAAKKNAGKKIAGGRKAAKKKSKKKVTPKKTAKAAARSPPAHKRVVPSVVVKRVKQPLPDTWPTEDLLRQTGLCAEAQADGIPCTALGRHCEICERADPKDST